MSELGNRKAGSGENLLSTPDNRRLLEFIGENRLFEEGRGLGA